MKKGANRARDITEGMDIIIFLDTKLDGVGDVGKVKFIH